VTPITRKSLRMEIFELLVIVAAVAILLR